ncbi:tetratricopeptide repeat protein [Mesorhizobium sp. M6A.T.Cr.TU.016.01.1.1]|uniref:tetratricopeptide repeat protein n=1 Tax=Mesorhizobium sp. M6A.T.Cr.TU.016.01.1.1 TaxID=2493677 RepID=UPI000F74F7C9|nr:tetratricopeptide repeat protein [Mesorhizobium sp. M6A.T.Cr.TU.016.01.1.1]AZO68026.1 tetratricopeptide repeat protein [Mesorhizobium sp. M6A.T.Cr.TU.016.01.1.1]
MSEFVKKRVLKDLIDELGDLDATSLEIIGHKVIETLENKDLVHHGLNKDYSPVGYTVDTFSQDFAVVGEYSTEQGYFEDSSGRKKEYRFDKIQKDVSHAIEKAGGRVLSKIYLVSRDEEPPSFRGEFNNSEIAKKQGDVINFLDARELAKVIFQSVQDHTNAAEFYCDFLPDFRQNLDNYEYYGRVPPFCENHHSEPSFLEGIQRHFDAGNNVCVLHGLSGSGKTQAAIDYVHSAIERFGNYLWISGQDWSEGVPLTAVKRARGGVAINVAGVFNSTRTLLVIDDLSRPFGNDALAELEVGFGLGGRVLITSQLGEPDSHVHLPVPQLSTSIAFKILGEDEAHSDELGRQFVEACRFSPLILAVTRQIATLEGVDRNDLYREILELPGLTHQADGSSIMARLLGRVSEVSRSALIKIANSGCTNYDSRFLNHFIGINARSALQRLGLLNRTAVSSTLSVHDLICAAVRTENADSRDLARSIELFVERAKGEMLPSVLRQIHLSALQLLEEHERRGKRDPDWLTYALLQLERVARNRLMADLHGLELKPDMPLAELLSVVDAKEAFSYGLGQDDRSAFYAACAAEYGRIADGTTSADVRAEMLHHQGKALRRSGELRGALECFKELLEAGAPWHATLGQIAHLGTQEGADETIRAEGASALRTLIEDVNSDLYSVPLRVSLSSLSRVRSYSEIARYVGRDADTAKQFADVVSLSALAGFDQFYEGFLALTSLFSYEFGDVCLAVVEAFPDMLAIFPNSVDKKQWGNVCEALANVASVASRQGKVDLASKLYAAATAFATTLNAQSDRSYDIRIVTKTLLAAGDAAGALAAADRISDGNKDHWLLYQKAKAQLALGNDKDAIATASKALDLASNDQRAQSRMSIYHDLVALCLEALGRVPEAIDRLATAVSLTESEKYSRDLEARLALLREKLPQ